ncbi:GIP [Symbiodinium necroappetens]|uniref:GIP protein n=1 Tax=Symbiodinium necroappetens TaxID=1628268 RepID=A0A812YTL6_9DINO|nr:GIP [Symbiodinium necroappetens]
MPGPPAMDCSSPTNKRAREQADPNRLNVIYVCWQRVILKEIAPESLRELRDDVNRALNKRQTDDFDMYMQFREWKKNKKGPASSKDGSFEMIKEEDSESGCTLDSRFTHFNQRTGSRGRRLTTPSPASPGRPPRGPPPPQPVTTRLPTKTQSSSRMSTSSANSSKATTNKMMEIDHEKLWYESNALVTDKKAQQEIFTSAFHILDPNTPTCDCRRGRKVELSATTQNPNKVFYNCANLEPQSQCGVFRWAPVQPLLDEGFMEMRARVAKCYPRDLTSRELLVRILQDSCPHHWTVATGSNAFVQRTRCRICHKVINIERKVNSSPEMTSGNETEHFDEKEYEAFVQWKRDRQALNLSDRALKAFLKERRAPETDMSVLRCPPQHQQIWRRHAVIANSSWLTKEADREFATECDVPWQQVHLHDVGEMKRDSQERSNRYAREYGNVEQKIKEATRTENFDTMRSENFHTIPRKEMAERAAKANEEVLQEARNLKCSVCEKFASVRPPRKAAPPREFGINEVIGMDTVWLPTVGQKQKRVALNIIDYSSHFQTMIPLRGRSPEAEWVKFFGPPRQIWADQGSEFKGAFKVMLEKTMADYCCESYNEWLELVDVTVMVKNRLVFYQKDKTMPKLEVDLDLETPGGPRPSQDYVTGQMVYFYRLGQGSFRKEPMRGYIDLSDEPLPDLEEMDDEPDHGEEGVAQPEPVLRRVRGKRMPERALPEPMRDEQDDVIMPQAVPLGPAETEETFEESQPGPAGAALLPASCEDDEEGVPEPPAKRTRVQILEAYYAKLETLFKTRQRKEVKLKELNQKDLQCFLKATEKEIQNKLNTQAYEKLTAEESERVRRTRPDRIMESRYVRTVKPLELCDVDKANMEGTLLSSNHGGLCKAKVRHVMKGFSEEGAEDLDSAEKFTVGVRVTPIPINKLRVSVVTDASWGNAEDGQAREDDSSDFWTDQICMVWPLPARPGCAKTAQSESKWTPGIRKARPSPWRALDRADSFSEGRARTSASGDFRRFSSESADAKSGWALDYFP